MNDMEKASEAGTVDEEEGKAKYALAVEPVEWALG